MHRIEPFYLWRDYYRAEDDPISPTYGKEYSELYFSHKIYNFVIHPQWDSIGSETLFYKLLYADQEQACAVIELLGEWNDCISNDIMLLRKYLIDPLMDQGIQNFVLIMENVLTFHAWQTDYYEDWREEIEGEIYLVNALPQVIDELNQYQFANYLWYDGPLNEIDWRVQKPDSLLDDIRSNLSRLVY